MQPVATPPPLPTQLHRSPTVPPPLPAAVIPLCYGPPVGSIFRRHAAKWSALLAVLASIGAFVVAPDGDRLLAACGSFPLAFALSLRLSGAVARFAPWALLLLAFALGLSLSCILAYAAADSLNPPDAYYGAYVVLPGWPLPLALMSFLWLPALLLVLRRDGIVFQHAGARRDVVPFTYAMGLLFSLAHMLVVLGGAAIGGHGVHVRTIASADGAYRAELYKSHWLGEAHYHLYLCKPSPAPMLGRRLDSKGPLETAATADLVPATDGSTLSVRTDGTTVMKFDPHTGRLLH